MMVQTGPIRDDFLAFAHPSVEASLDRLRNGKRTAEA